GLAFQITDDLLDVEGDAGQAGKRLRKDAGRGKLTYPGLLGVAESRRRAERLCREACDALAPLRGAGARPAPLARYVLERDRSPAAGFPPGVEGAGVTPAARRVISPDFGCGRDMDGSFAH